MMMIENNDTIKGMTEKTNSAVPDTIQKTVKKIDFYC